MGSGCWRRQGAGGRIKQSETCMKKAMWKPFGKLIKNETLKKRKIEACTLCEQIILLPEAVFFRKNPNARHGTPKAIQSVFIALGLPLELDGKILLLKACTLVLLQLIWKLLSHQLFFIAGADVIQAAGGEKSLMVFLDANPLSENINQPGKMCPLIKQWHEYFQGNQPPFKATVLKGLVRRSGGGDRPFGSGTGAKSQSFWNNIGRAQKEAAEQSIGKWNVLRL